MGNVLEQFCLAGKKALVTGGSRGLGASFAVALIEAGADVAVASRSGEAPDVARAAAASGRRLFVRRADLSRRREQGSLVSAAVRELGGLDILVNNAGINYREEAAGFPSAKWREIIEINLTAVFELSRRAAAFMPPGGGRIINIASVQSFRAGRLIPAYTAAKTGLLGLTRALAREWAARGVTVNAIAPGYFATEMTRPLREDPVRNGEIIAHIPMGRWGEPDELTGALLMLASEAGRYITGQAIVVDGGYLLE